MKRIFFSVACAAMILLTSCGGNSSKIEKVKDLKKEYMELIDEARNCDNPEEAEKINKRAEEIQEKAFKLIKELEESDLTEEELKEINSL